MQLQTLKVRATLHEVKGARGPSWYFSYNLKGSRVRSARFRDRDVAQWEMEKIESRYEVREIYQPTSLTRDEVKDAEAAILALRKEYPKKSLVEAAAWFAEHYRDPSSSPSVRDACVTFLAEIPISRRARSRNEYVVHFRDLTEAFGDKHLAELTTEDFRNYINRPKWGQISRWHRRQTASRLYNWAIKRTPPLVDVNPLQGIDKMTKKGLRMVLPRVAVLTPVEAKKLLTVAIATPHISYAVLAMFAGMRREEIKKFSAQPGGGWDDISFEAGTISVSESVGKTGRRVIAIKPALEKWLNWLRANGRTNFYPPNLNKGWNRVRKSSLSPEKLKRTNLPRHSFITYSARLKAASYAQLSRDAGNSESMIKEHYDDVQANAAMANAYWALSPRRILKGADKG